MKASRHYTERRKHERARVQDIVLGILNAGELETIGSISDMSLGGIKYTYNDLSATPGDHPIHSVDLIADNDFLFDIPCEYAWKVKVEKGSQTKLSNLKQCGIKFGKLTPNQLFLLRGFINRCAPPRGKNLSVRAHIPSSN